MNVRIIAAVIALAIAVPFNAFAQRGTQVLNQATSFAAITPSDTIQLRSPTKGIYIGDTSDCDVALIGAQDQAPEVFASIARGVSHPLSIIQVMATDTTCTAIKGLW